jgi:hypothetical protein
MNSRAQYTARRLTRIFTTMTLTRTALMEARSTQAWKITDTDIMRPPTWKPQYTERDYANSNTDCPPGSPGEDEHYHHG